MIREIAEITVKEGGEAAFEAAVAAAAPHFLAAEGCHGLTLRRVIETPRVYRLVVEWETVEHHMVIFRGSEGFQEWRRLAGPHFAEAPKVTHSKEIALTP